ncbi:hypothetical protein MMC10_011369 [Thelotrema lepadinum]|nr:hypothetical protein [Thelotrema lepadinum]
MLLHNFEHFTKRGRFLLAQLHLTSLVDRTSVKDMKNALEKLPKGSNAYDKAYEEAMARINSQSEGLRILANRVLSWIIFAKRLLNIVELQHALAIESNTSDLDEDNIPDVDQMISICTGLITLDQENKVVRVAHYTIQEYFVRAKMQWFVAAETDITNACITYLSYTVFESGPCSLNPDYTERLQQYLFYGYAALHWGLHARDASLPMDQVVRFLQNQPCLRAAAQGLIVKNETWILPGEESWQLDGLHIAAYFGLHNVARQLIQQGSSLKSKDFRGRTPLSYAAAQGQTAMVKLLFEADESDVDTPDDAHEQTPLWYAATNGHTSTVELLLTTGEVHVNSRNYRGLTPLIMASRGAYIDIVELFVRSKDLDPNSADEDGWTALHHASSNGTLRIIELLLNVESINMEPEDNDYVTPLMIAARYGGKEATEKLLSTGKVNVNARRPDGPTPLAHAVLSGHEGIVKLLLSYPQLEVDCKNNWGVTPLALAVGTDENVVKLLLDSGKAIADLKDAEGSTPLARAANWDRADIVKILLDTGQVDPDSKDSNGRTPLSLAASHSGPDVIRQLLHIDIVDQNSRDQRDWTPLRWAIFAGSDRGVRGLLESSRIEIDVKDEDGRTPLFFAVERASLSIVKQLLDTGQVDVDAQDSEGDTPMTLAAYAGIPEFFPILQALQGYKKTLQLDAEEAPTGRIRDQTESNSEADLVAKLVSERARLSPSFKGPASGDPFALSDRSLNHMDKSAKKTSLKKGASVDTAVAKKVTFETEATLLSYTY